MHLNSFFALIKIKLERCEKKETSRFTIAQEPQKKWIIKMVWRINVYIIVIIIIWMIVVLLFLSILRSKQNNKEQKKKPQTTLLYMHIKYAYVIITLYYKNIASLKCVPFSVCLFALLWEYIFSLKYKYVSHDSSNILAYHWCMVLRVTLLLFR